ncbi:MBL fold metallo-hydrolase [Legionella maceachernii]|uniref:Metallo-beta-lactamase superfamily protein n=1 Tax=Legionella maceachernii TaxID=466 RepID=A0A0W0WEE8_9GAMM|nr:MBL fold metallo-hydrolase [Legionella maceachernii]KTD30687.1 Metallo-beta-lactamase superfamily protein [Legionella maceachernii]SJZ80224.1 7,8-dihydropterin-6-yl-methyl-4-(beta-D-ribofuranosyl)aminobenzene 5'-phosphate synthase [Legionella maceachernii]SUP02851.1 Metallo-beta-lactamase superfamily [Legionella maceachernii]
MNLVEVDTLDVQVIVDNVTDSLSSVPVNVTHEMDYLEQYGMKELSGECLCCGAHGLSLLLTASSGRIRHSILFDAGPEGEVFLRNMNKLKIDPTIIEEIVLSHGHWDHAGGFLEALKLIKSKNAQQKVVFHLNSEMFHQRALKLDGHIHPFKRIPSVEELENLGAELVVSGQARSLLDKMFYLSGEIPRVTPYEKGFPEHVKQLPNQEWVSDPLIMDERFLAVHVRNKGLVVFSACSHAGIINVLNEARNLFPGVPLYAVMGGFHLSGRSVEKIIHETVHDMKQFDLKMIIPAHCTGWRAVNALGNAFGDSIVVPSAVGRLYQF